MRSYRILWAVVGVLVGVGALFVPVVSLPVVGGAFLLARFLGRRAVQWSGDIVSDGALGPAVVALGLVGGLVFVWSVRAYDTGWNVFGTDEAALGPNPPAANGSAAWLEVLLRTPAENLVRHDPYYAGVLLPALIVGLPVVLVVAVVLAARRPAG